MVMNHEKEKKVAHCDTKEEDSADKSMNASRSVSPIPPPEEFLCPITHQVMNDPVTNTMGHTYERKAIMTWLMMEGSDRKGCRCPLTRKYLKPCDFVPNKNLQTEIQNWQQQQQQQQQFLLQHSKEKKQNVSTIPIPKEEDRKILAYVPLNDKDEMRLNRHRNNSGNGAVRTPTSTRVALATDAETTTSHNRLWARTLPSKIARNANNELYDNHAVVNPIGPRPETQQLEKQYRGDDPSQLPQSKGESVISSTYIDRKKKAQKRHFHGHVGTYE